MSKHQPSRPVIVAAALLALVSACASSSPQLAATADPEVTMDSLVTAEWLSEHLDHPDLVVFDCTVTLEQTEEGMRAVSGRAAYEAGHIPGAGFADLTDELADGDNPQKYALPTPEEFARVMGELGVGDDSMVVLYDSSMSAWAARVWWMLRWIGFDRAALLDGGLGAWKAAGLPLSTETPVRSPKKLTPAPRWDLVADRDEVLAAISDENVQLVDAMPAAHYRGEMTMYARPGHIPSAVNVPVTSLVDDSGRYLPVDELSSLLDLDRETRAITYCGGGIAASSDAFIMTRLGYTDVAVYISSLQEWAADPENPMVVETP
ncbi:MAG: sulfurtransferase [Holophagae bacterium]|jgi:thiosulfate/3-mercaptopyruvate sulfurtransferase